jgi:hypothetical protein
VDAPNPRTKEIFYRVRYRGIPSGKLGTSLRARAHPIATERSASPRCSSPRHTSPPLFLAAASAHPSPRCRRATMDRRASAVSERHYGKKGIAVQPIIVVHRCTANTSLPCAASSTHVKDKPHGKV